MELKIQAIHFDTTAKLNLFIEKKAAKLQKNCENIIKAEFILKVVKPETARRLPTTQWSHVVFTLDNGTGILYLNGEEIARNEHLTIKPTDFSPVLNYIGRSQYPADPLFKGHIRQVVINNHALTPEEVKNEATAIKDIHCEDAAERDNAHDAYLLNGIRATDKTRGIVIQGGRKMKISR